MLTDPWRDSFDTAEAVIVRSAPREYYIRWDYAPARKDLTHDEPLPANLQERTVWQKVRFVEYTDPGFKNASANLSG